MLGMLRGMPRSERRVDSDRTPVGIHIAAGMATVLAAVVAAAMLPAPAEPDSAVFAAGWWRLVPVAAALLVFGAVTVAPAAVAFVATVAYLLVTGFLVDRYGVLTWHGAPDIYRLLVIVISAGAGLAVGAGWRWMRRRRRLLVPPEWGRSDGGPTDFDMYE
jgi:hypothetical protein